MGRSATEARGTATSTRSSVLASGSARRASAWSLRFLLPAMIVGANLAVVAQQALVALHFECRHARQSAAERARLLGARLASDTRGPLALGDDAALERALETAAEADPSDLALIVGGDDRVIVSSDPRWRNRALIDTPLAEAIGAVRVARRDRAPQDAALDETMISVHPMTGHGLASASVATTAPGVLVLALNAAARFEIERDRIATSVLVSATCVLVIGLLFWLLTRRLLLAPLARLLEPTASDGDARAATPRRGRPVEEIVRIGEAMDALVAVTDERERALAARGRLARIVEALLNEIYVIDAESLALLDANRAARTNLGYSAEELRGLYLWDIVGGEDRERVESWIGTEMARFRSSESLLHDLPDGWNLRKDGSTYPVSVQVQYVGSERPPVLVGICQDMTEQRRRDERVRLRERAIEAVEAGILITDATVAGYPIVYANRALCEMTGYAPEELLGRPPSLLQGEHLTQPGVRLIREAQAHGSSVQTRLDCIRRDGSRFVMRLTLSPVHDAGGSLTHYIGIHEDITRETETETKLLQAQRIDAVGRLAGGVAHDFNNLLDIVVGNLELLARHGLERVDRERLEEARRAAGMGAKLTRRLLAFARQSPLEPSVIDVSERLRDTLSLLRASVGESIVIDTDLAEKPWPALVDPSEIENTAVNLVINARDAIAGEGRIRIVTENVRLGDDEAEGMVAGDYVRLSVSDDGCGMHEQVAERAFEPFFTTKNPGRGTGLGLASIHGFARQSGGGVTMATAVGRGTTVNVYLPRHDGEHRDAESDGEPRAEDAFEGRALIVEDNEKVREITHLRLRSLGFTTLEAGDGARAKRVLERDERIDLVLSDIVMPGGVSGYDLARWVRESGRDCPVLLVSGFAEPEIADETPDGLAPPRVLAKPYGLEDLREAIADVLATSRRRPSSTERRGTRPVTVAPED